MLVIKDFFALAVFLGAIWAMELWTRVASVFL
jgi:hypothetical protein